jgi:hypothetical protein
MLAPTPPTARLLRLAGRLHSLGPRPLAEYLAEIIAGADPVLRLEAGGAPAKRGDKRRAATRRPDPVCPPKQ